jgi:hypothetical protein
LLQNQYNKIRIITFELFIFLNMVNIIIFELHIDIF